MMNATKIGVIQPQVRDFERRYGITLDFAAILAACESADTLTVSDDFLKTFAPADATDKTAGNDALLSALEKAYFDFSDGGKWAFGSAYDTVVNHIRRGDIAAAKLTVQMIQIPAEVPETSPEELATWTSKKAEILALFP